MAVMMSRYIFLIATIFLINSTMAEEHKELKLVVQGNGQFTKNLYQVLASKPGNVFFSPISVHSVLSMLSHGSTGQTQKAFVDTLKVDSAVAANGYDEVLKRLNNVKDVTLLMANKIFLKSGYKLKEAYANIVSKNYHSEVQLVDFLKGSDAAKTINTWVENKTKDKIKDLVSADDFNEDTRLVLVNAIYFKGNWQYPFDPKNTVTEKFYLNENDSVDVQMMHLTKKFNYKNDENLDAKVLELPYSNKQLSMIIILPNKRDGIAELEQKLVDVDLAKITENMYQPEVKISLPKFKIEQTIDLKDPLTKMGLGNIFGREAELSGMLESPEPLFISKAVQKAFIEVNEEGAEAAAATGMQIRMRRGAGLTEEFNANKPFVILIKDNNNIKMFHGKISQPTVALKSHDEL